LELTGAMLKVSPVVPRDPDHGTHQSRTAARDRASVRWRTQLRPNAVRPKANEGSSPGWGTTAHAVDRARQGVAR
jgi:hypothetical protein